MSGWRHKLHKLTYVWRVIASGLAFAVFGLGCILLGVAVFPLIRLVSPNAGTTRRRVRLSVHYSYRCCVGIWRALGVISYEIHGYERLTAPGQLVVANHPSLIDVVFIGTQMPQMDCIVKDALMRNPFLRAPVRWADYILNSAPVHLIENCVATLHAGNSLLVFPEGTRSVPGQPLKMQRGAAHIALAAGCDLLPVTIRCHPSWLTKSDVWYRVARHRPHWCLSVGEPIQLASLVQPGEPASLSARRITAHLTEYFNARARPVVTLPVASLSTRPAAARTAINS